MTLEDTIARIEKELVERRLTLTKVAAQVTGLEAELRALRAGVADSAGLVHLDRTEAILTVLRRSDVSLSPAEVTERLDAEGRGDTSKLVTSTLSYLLRSGHVHRPERGRYLPV